MSSLPFEDDALPLSLRRTRRVHRKLPKQFRDMLPELPLPLRKGYIRKWVSIEKAENR